MQNPNQGVATTVIIALLLSLAPAGGSLQAAGVATETQLVMDSNLSPEQKMDCLYTGGCSASALDAGAAAAEKGSAEGQNGLQAASKSPGTGLDKGSVPAPAASADSQKQVRIGYWGYDNNTGALLIIGAIVVAAIIIGAKNPPKYSTYCYEDAWGYTTCSTYENY